MFGLGEKAMMIIIGALLVALAGMWAYCAISTGILKKDLAEAHQQVGELQVKVATLKASNALLTSSVKTQNVAISGLEAKQEQATKDVTKALTEEKKRASKWQARYSEILNAPKVGDSCNNLEVKMTEYFTERHREEESQ